MCAEAECASRSSTQRGQFLTESTGSNEVSRQGSNRLESVRVITCHYLAVEKPGRVMDAFGELGEFRTSHQRKDAVLPLKLPLVLC